jgi:hypothetical protein
LNPGCFAGEAGKTDRRGRPPLLQIDDGGCSRLDREAGPVRRLRRAAVVFVGPPARRPPVGVIVGAFGMW